MTRLYTPGIRREKVSIPQAMVIVDSKQAVSEDAFALHNLWRDWSAQFPEKPCDHMALIYPRIVGLRHSDPSTFPGNIHYALVVRAAASGKHAFS